MEDSERTGDTGTHRDPITGAPGAHPVGTGVGALLGGAAAGAATGTIAGPISTRAPASTTPSPTWHAAGTMHVALRP